ncbi:acetyl-CoA carboxylase biotin carboxyl carrier protein subunit [Bacteroidota bacterium]
MASKKDKKTEKPKYQLLNIDFVKYKTLLSDKYKNRKAYEPKDHRIVTAFIPGTIKEVFVKEGDSVNIGDSLLQLEAMKMKNILLSPLKGKVVSIEVSSEDTVAKNQVLVTLDYDEAQND